jgi:uncharacterized membrane protein (DUF373 family)
MKYLLRNFISSLSSYAEIVLSAVILIGVVLASGGLVLNIFRIYTSLGSESFQEFLGFALTLIIAIALSKMLSHHTPGSAVEVLMFAIARKLIIHINNTPFDLLLGVVAIAILFIVKRYFIFGNHNQDSIMVKAATSIANARKITGMDIPDGIAETIGGLVSRIAKEEGRKLVEGEVYCLEGIDMRIGKLRDGTIEMVEFLKEERKFPKKK